jgi:hypothetical protein
MTTTRSEGYTVQVTNENGVTWSVRFLSETSAWKRICTLKGMHDTRRARELLAAKGWKVENKP